MRPRGAVDDDTVGVEFSGAMEEETLAVSLR